MNKNVLNPLCYKKQPQGTLLLVSYSAVCGRQAGRQAGRTSSSCQTIGRKVAEKALKSHCMFDYRLKIS